MAPQNKVALITGGASGMGLAVAQLLASKGGWTLHLLDLNAEAGNTAGSSLPNTTFHQTDITNYDVLASTFQTVFQSSHRLDFVFANAGIAERGDFYARHPSSSPTDTFSPPPPPNLNILRVNIDAVVSTAHLAQHYFRLNSKTEPAVDASLVMTSSCGGLYPSHYTPIYTSSKHAVVGLTRSLAKHLYTHDLIRVNAICPGLVRTSLLPSTEWANFPPDMFTPLDKIAQTVVMLVEGGDEAPPGETRVDSGGRGREEKKGVLWGEVVEISGGRHYYREAPGVCDAAMGEVMRATDIQDGDYVR